MDESPGLGQGQPRWHKTLSVETRDQSRQYFCRWFLAEIRKVAVSESSSDLKIPQPDRDLVQLGLSPLPKGSNVAQ
jgi:hypothetical protein